MANWGKHPVCYAPCIVRLRGRRASKHVGEGMAEAEKDLHSDLVDLSRVSLAELAFMDDPKLATSLARVVRQACDSVGDAQSEEMSLVRSFDGRTPRASNSE